MQSGGWTDGQTEMTKLVASFRNFKNTENLLKPYLLICISDYSYVPRYLGWWTCLQRNSKPRFRNYSKIRFQTSFHFHQLQLFVSKYIKSYMLSNMKNSPEKYVANVEI
jgi:hypothetical protein